MTPPLDDVAARLTAAMPDRYRVERELGAGGMATVYLARDLRHDRDVAIKVLHQELAAALGSERFLTEIKTTARLQHPHILPLLDSGEAGGLLYYVMPYVTGETLRARLERERQLPIDDALLIAREVADALGSAHAIGIIHRDIKPENILLQGGHALVADFGIALAVQSAGGTRMTQTGLSLGTPQYMSPEQAMGEKKIDSRSDLYALGAVTYEMLVGEPPFTGPSVQAIVARVMTEEPRGIASQRKSVPPGVEVAVMRALEKLPADRFATASEFLAALGANVSAVRTRPSRAGRRRGYVVAGLGAALICAAGGWLVGRRANRRPAARAMSVSIVLPDSLTLQPLITNTEGMATIALSPDGSQLAFVARRAGNPQLFIRRMSDFGVKMIDGTEGALAPFFSPRGDAIGFFAGSTLKRVTLADGRVTTLAQDILEAWGGAFASDGRIVISKARATTLIVLSPSGDSVRAIACARLCSFPEVLPDNRHVIVTTRAGLAVVDIDAGVERPLLRWDAKSPLDEVRGTSARYDGDTRLVYVSPNGEVFAVPFDAGHARVTGPPVELADGVRVEAGRGAVQFALSSAGVMAYAPGQVMSIGILVRADRSGRLDTIPAPPANYNSIDLSPDGRRAVVRLGTATGDNALEIVDVETGKVTPLLSGASVGNPRWGPDGRKVYFQKDSNFVVVDPELSATPQPVPATRGLVNVESLRDGKGYLGWHRDTIVVLHADGSPSQRVPAVPSVAATSNDARWSVAEEPQTNESAIVARSLDGAGRRIVIATGGRFAMAAWAANGHEFIVADAQRSRDRSTPGQTVQGFWAIAYDPSRPDNPFAEPRPLFRAAVADFPGRNYSVGMGGNRFVFKQRMTVSLPGEVRVITGWHAALARGLP